MTITYRGVKLEALTYAEVDENFRDLREDTDLQRVLENGNTSNLVINIERVSANTIFANNLNVINSVVINETEINVTSNILTANIVVTSNLILGGINAISRIESSSGQANGAFAQANIVFGQANTARDHANLAFAQANTARDQANSVLYLGYTLYTANGTFTVPTGVNTIFAIAIGGGGGGSANTGAVTVDGGYGGIGANYITVTPGQVMQIGVGRGGIASNTTTGASGTSSNVGSLVATGGTGTGTAGDKTGGLAFSFSRVDQVFSGNDASSAEDNQLVALMTHVPPNFLAKRELAYIAASDPSTPRSGIANVQYVTMTSAFAPGARGLGETSAVGISSNNASGGADGAVFIFY